MIYPFVFVHARWKQDMAIPFRRVDDGRNKRQTVGLIINLEKTRYSAENIIFIFDIRLNENNSFPDFWDRSSFSTLLYRKPLTPGLIFTPPTKKAEGSAQIQTRTQGRERKINVYGITYSPRSKKSEPFRPGEVSVPCLRLWIIQSEWPPKHWQRGVSGQWPLHTC